MNNKIKIPVAVQLRVDDVAWHNGADQRFVGLPSRSGLPRHHSVLDYHVLNEIGKGVNMKISCALVLGEWDKDNLLRGEKNVTYNMSGWNRAAEIDYDYANKAFELLESSEYIDYTWHSLLHGFYHKDKLVTEKVLNPFRYDAEKDEYISGEYTWLTEDEFRRHIALWFRIYDNWGFKKRVKSYAPPCGDWGVPDDDGNKMYAEVLKEYGIYVWESIFANSFEGGADVCNGVVCMKAGGEDVGVSLPWNAYDVDPDFINLYIPDGTHNPNADFRVHWTNLIRWQSEKNMEYVPKWIAYLKRQSEVFGTMLSRDVEFAASQAIYSRYAKLSFEDQKCIIDLKEADAKKAVVLKNEFYISFKNGIEPKQCLGGTIELYECKKEFKTYKITRNNGIDTVSVIF